jgi:hypothetical protein
MLGDGRGSSSWVLPLIFLFIQSTTGKAGGLPAGHNAGSEIARPSVEATPTDRAPKLDGTLNDPLWQLAAPITDFRQREPDEGQPATEKTEVRILYTRMRCISEFTVMTRRLPGSSPRNATGCRETYVRFCERLTAPPMSALQFSACEPEAESFLASPSPADAAVFQWEDLADQNPTWSGKGCGSLDQVPSF